MSANPRRRGMASLDQKLEIATADQLSSALYGVRRQSHASTPLWMDQRPGYVLTLRRIQSGVGGCAFATAVHGARIISRARLKYRS